MATEKELRTIFTGWAYKQNAKGTKWNRRHFELREDRILSYSTDFQVLTPKLLGTIDLGNPATRVLDATETAQQDREGWHHNWPKWPRNLRTGSAFAIDTPARTFFLYCDSPEVARHFVTVLKEVRQADMRIYIAPAAPHTTSHDQPQQQQHQHQQHQQQHPHDEKHDEKHNQQHHAAGAGQTESDDRGAFGEFFHDVGDFVEGWMETYTGKREVLHEFRRTNLKEIKGMLHDAFEVYGMKDEEVAEEQNRLALFFELMRDFFRELVKILYSLFRQRKDFFALARVFKFFGLIFNPVGFIVLALKDVFEITFRGRQATGEFQHMVSEFQQSHYMDAGKWFGLLCKRFTTIF